MAFFNGCNVILFRGVDLFQTVFSYFLCKGARTFVLCIIFLARKLAAILVLVAQTRFFFGGLSLLSQQSLAVFFGDLIIIGVNFAKGQKAMPVAAEIDECSLQAWFYSGYLSKIDIAFDLLVFSRFKVKFINSIAFEHRHPGFFRVARIDQHARCHV